MLLLGVSSVAVRFAFGTFLNEFGNDFGRFLIKKSKVGGKVRGLLLNSEFRLRSQIGQTARIALLRSLKFNN
jgi:hypothetical protein